MNTRKRLLIASITFALAACSGGGGGGGGDEPQTATPDVPKTPEPPVETTVAALCDASYSAASAPQGEIVGGTASSVQNGVVTIHEWNGDDWSTPINTTTTDNHGRFAFSSVSALNGPVRFDLTATVNTRLRCESPTGCGSAQAGEYYAMPLDYKLSTIVSSEELAANRTVALSPVTNIAAQWAMDMPKGVSRETLALSKARVQTLLELESDFATSLPVPMADCSAIRTASPGDQNHAIVSAAFADLAADEGYPFELMVGGAAQMYSLLGGQVLTGSGELSKQDIQTALEQYPQYSDAAQRILDSIPFDNLSLAGLDRLMASAADVVRGLEEGGAFAPVDGNNLRSRLAQLVTKWDGRLVTNLLESTAFNAEDFATGTSLLNVYDGYRQAALSAEADIDAANRNLGWLYIDEQAMANTEGMVAAVSDALKWAVDGSTCVAIRNALPLATSCSPNLLVLKYDSPIDADNRITFNRSTSTLRLLGTWETSQQVNLTVGVQDIRDLLRNGLMTIRLNGSVSNATASTNFDNFAIELDIRDNDLAPFQNLTISQFANTEVMTPLLEDLAADLNIRIGLKGDLAINSTNTAIGSYSIQGMDTFLDFKSQVITQGQAAPVLAYGSTSLTTNSAGETQGPVNGAQMFSLVVDDPLTLQTAYQFKKLGLPTMIVEAGGDLTGYEDIVATLTDYIAALLDNNPDASQIDYDLVYEELQVLFGGMDFTALALNGDNKLRILPDGEAEQVYSLTTAEDGGVSIADGTTGEAQATLYIRGTAGYVYTNDTLVAVANFGDETEGLLVNLADGTQRAYPVEVRDDEKALLAATWSLLESLFGDLFTTEQPASP